ncbi:MAG: ferrochelatase [Saprospiraceae bacterium]|jgi:ferrochelatase
MKALLLVNLGTPDSPDKKAVKKYLREFLNDGRVIDFPKLKRTLLVNGIIIPARAGNSTALYKEVWTEKGSPLLFHTEDLTEKMKGEMGEDWDVYMGMRYQSPSLESVMSVIENKAYSELVIVPLYPQYASSSTGSTSQKMMEIISKWEVIPTFRMINSFFEKPEFIDVLAENGAKYDVNSYDHVLFSYHGLPERHIQKSCKIDGCTTASCISKCDAESMYCYRSACYETTRQVVAKLGLKEGQYTVAFQSRLGKDPWIQPFSDVVIADLAKNGIKRMLVFSPAFVADCLETIVEIGVEYQEIFEEHGGEKIQLVESMNSADNWVKALKDIVLDKSY